MISGFASFEAVEFSTFETVKNYLFIEIVIDFSFRVREIKKHMLMWACVLVWLFACVLVLIISIGLGKNLLKWLPWHHRLLR